MAEQDKNNQTNITPFGAAPTNTFGGVYMQPSQFATPQMQQPRYKSPTSFAPNVQPQQVQPATTEKVQPINQPISYDVTGKAGQIQLPTGGASSFVPDVRQYVNDAGNVLFIPFVNGKPLYPIPEGYKAVGEEEEKPQQQQQITQTAKVTEESDGGDGGQDSFETGVAGTRSKESVRDVSISDLSLTEGQLDTPLGAQTALNGLDSISFDKDGTMNVGMSFAKRTAIGALSPIPGTGAVLGIGNAVNRGAALTSLANTLGMPIDSYDAFGAAFSGNTSNMAIDMQNAFTTSQLQNAIEHAKLDSMEAMLDMGMTVGSVMDSKGNVTGSFSVDKDGNYSFSSFGSFIDANFRGSMAKQSKDSIEAQRSKLDPLANFNEDAYAGKVQTFRDSKTTVTFDKTRQEALDVLDSRDQDFDDDDTRGGFGESAIGRSQADRDAAEADIAGRIDSGQYGPSVDAIRDAAEDDDDDDGGDDGGVDDGGGGGDLGPGDEGSGDGFGDSPYMKGGFVKKKHMGKKKTQPKRKGLAAKR